MEGKKARREEEFNEEISFNKNLRGKEEKKAMTKWEELQKMQKLQETGRL